LRVSANLAGKEWSWSRDSCWTWARLSLRQAIAHSLA